MDKEMQGLLQAMEAKRNEAEKAANAWEDLRMEFDIGSGLVRD